MTVRTNKLRTGQVVLTPFGKPRVVESVVDVRNRYIIRLLDPRTGHISTVHRDPGTWTVI